MPQGGASCICGGLSWAQNEVEFGGSSPPVSAYAVHFSSDRQGASAERIVINCKPEPIVQPDPAFKFKGATTLATFDQTGAGDLMQKLGFP